MESVPKELRNLRACLLCSLVKTLEQFEYDGCENCEKFLRLKNNKENILTCTSANFDGIISLMTPEDSWVARWQRIDTQARGCYAISVSGKLPSHVVRELKARGVTYRSRDRTNQ
ncbi:transcription elongation factor SPT4-like [Orbicella faveolata]|uniref:transcription elongation factor SPT4-like n=1 Tax=Orbicella faveolata TaxID=48498 RepID=UPI0009E2DDB3|nr:transcription elongation factor SPT4-like [Orbicella faveolata]